MNLPKIGARYIDPITKVTGTVTGYGFEREEPYFLVELDPEFKGYVAHPDDVKRIFISGIIVHWTNYREN